MCIGLHLNGPLLFRILVKLEISRKILGKYSNTKFHENTSGGSRFVPCERTDWQNDGQMRLEANNGFEQFSESAYLIKIFVCAA